MIEIFWIFIFIGLVIGFYLQNKKKIDKVQQKLEDPIKDIFK